MNAWEKGLGKVLFIVVIAVAGIAVAVAQGWTPLLGLDLQGGASVVLEAVEREGADPVDITDEDLDQSIEIIRNRVDGLGVAEPEIRRQGDTILIQLPGVENQQRALELVGATAELRFRPVLSQIDFASQGIPFATLEEVYAAAEAGPDSSTSSTTTSTTSTTVAEEAPDESSASTTTTPASTTTTLPVGNELTEDELRELDPVTLSRIRTEQVDDLDSETIELIDTIQSEQAEEAQQELFAQVTLPEDDLPEEPVLLPGTSEVGGSEVVVALYSLGPSLLTGDALSGAAFNQISIGDWGVNPTFRAGAEGIDLFNQAATLCFGGANPECPSQPGATEGNGALGIVLDSVVISAPSINVPTFTRDEVQITGGFDRDSAADLALQLRYGSLPIELEPQSVESVSASLGEDALNAGLVAGAIGLLLVAIYMIAYYRLLGVVAVLSLAISTSLLWVIIAYLGDNQGLALTLAGVTGIIVSIGVSVDSNVVYFENLKEDVRRGRTFRSSVDRGFSRAFSTIVKADVASLIAAGVLYWLTVGAVRGFAFYLGLATLLDLIVSYLFMGPAVRILGTSPRFYDRPKVFGMPPAEVTEEAAV